MAAHHVVAYATAASHLYAAARMLTMFWLAVVRETGNSKMPQPIRTLAKRLFRAYLTCVGVVGSTLVHEIFHCSGTPLSILTYPVWVFNYFRTFGFHCPTGCGQEKMSTAWFARVGKRVGFIPIVDSADPEAPAKFKEDSSDWGTWNPFSASGCKGRGDVLIVTRFPKWAKTPHDPVTLTWEMDIGSGKKDVFHRKCWQRNSQTKRVR